MAKDYHKNKEKPTIGEPPTDDDLRNLLKCFITREIAEAAEYSRVTNEQGAAILNRKRNASSNYSGLAIPYKHPVTGQILEYEIRRDFPDTKNVGGREKESGKYLRPTGAKSLPYFPPSTNPEHLTDPLVMLIFSEGAKKILAMLNALTDNLKKPLPFLLVGLSGVDNIKTSQTEIKATGEKRQVKDILPELKEIDFEGREVLIIYDTNVLTNKNVYFARHRLAETLLSLGAIVYFVNLPQIKGVNGIDDLLGLWERQHGCKKAIENFGELLKTKRRFVVDAVFSRPLCNENLTLKIEPGERNKVKVSALDADGKTVEMHLFNPADADKRSAFIKKQVEPAFNLTDSDKQEVTAELIRLADLAEIVTKAEKSKDKVIGETVETSFKVLSDGRIIEQIRGGFALYNPETNEHEIVERITDDDGTIYKPIDDDLFREGGFYIADGLTEYGTTDDLDAEMEKFLLTYVDLKPLPLKIAAKYARFTFLFDKVLELNYIQANGEPGAGKSRFGGAVTMISRRGLFLITPSAASVFRIADKFHPTMFFDEFNGNDSDDAAAIIQILNAGYQRTGKIARQLSKGDGEFQTVLFDGYCPKIIGSLKQSKSAAFNSRTVSIEMERTTRNDLPLRLKPRMLREAQDLQNKLTLYRLRNYDADWEERLDEAERILKSHQIVTRTIQVNIPLFALLESETVRAEYLQLLKTHDGNLIEQKQQTLDGEIVEKIHTLLIIEDDENGVQWNPSNISFAPVHGKVCEALRVERLHGIINARKQKEIDIRYFGKLLAGLGLHTKKITTRKSDYFQDKVIIFDYLRLNYLFKMFGFSVPDDFKKQADFLSDVISDDFNVINVINADNINKNDSLEVMTLNGSRAKNEIKCQQVNLSNNSTYKSDDIDDIKIPETNGNNKKYVRGVV